MSYQGRGAQARNNAQRTQFTDPNRFEQATARVNQARERTNRSRIGDQPRRPPRGLPPRYNARRYTEDDFDEEIVANRQVQENPFANAPRDRNGAIYGIFIEGTNPNNIRRPATPFNEQMDRRLNPPRVLPRREMDNNDRSEYYDYLAGIRHNLHAQAIEQGFTDDDLDNNEELAAHLNNLMENFARNWRLQRGFE